VRRLFLIAAVLSTLGALPLVLAGCSDSFNPPGLPDLKKTPYDFSVVVPPYMTDMRLDMSVTD
jgi:hypothetical protein